MRRFYLSLLSLAICCTISMRTAEAQTAPSTREPGLLEQIYKPFLNSTAFSLDTLIAFDRSAILVTYRGRCVSLKISGADQSARCEPRMAVTYSAHGKSIHWLTLGREAFGLESETMAEPVRDGVLRFQIMKINILKEGVIASEAVTGDCIIDAFYTECHIVGAKGRFDVAFATVGGPPTQQFPFEDSVFRIPKAEVFVARGQCLVLHDPDNDLTPYCADYVGQAVLDKTHIMTFFTSEAHTVFGFSGLIANKQKAKDGHSFTVPVTLMLRIKGDKVGTAPISGNCLEAEADGHRMVNCKVTTTREGAVFKASFDAMEPWRKALQN